MKGQIWIAASIAVALVILGEQPAAAQQFAPDFVLKNGKMITVDNRFTIAEAVAVRGERIVDVGTNDEIDALVGPETTVIDLEGRSVIPGLIDNHGHIMEEGPIWQLELRLDGIETRAEALQMMRDQAIALGTG
jgi:predicted amidohydrolase YtcJ